VEGEAGSPVTVVSLPSRRAGLEFVEKLLPTKLTSTDTTERNARCFSACRPVASLVDPADALSGWKRSVESVAQGLAGPVR
jgi:hypothetical protein